MVGAMGAPRLLRLNELRMSRVDRFAVVRNVVEIDGHIDRVPRDMGSGELPERPGERPLGAAEIEEGQKTTGVAVRGPSTAAGTSVGDGGALGGGAEHEIDEVSPSSCREGMGEGRGDQWVQPEVRLTAHLSICEGPTTGVSVGRGVFLSGTSSHRCGRKTAAAAVVVHTPSSAVFLSSTPGSTGIGRNQALTADGGGPSTGLRMRSRGNEEMRKTKKPKRNARDMVSVGIDLGDTTSHATIFANEKADTFEFPMDGLGHALLKERVPSDAWIVFESSGATYPFYRQLRELGFADITVAHPKELSWIVRSKKKSDKVDSQKLAKLRSVGMIPEAHLLEREDQIFRDLLIQRVKIGAEVSQIKNGIIGYLKREGLFQDLPDSVANFSEERSEPIRAISFRDDRDLVLSTMTNRLEFTEKLAPSLEKRIKAQA